MKVGIVALQGGFCEHVYMLRKLAEETGWSIEPVLVKKPSNLRGLDAVIIPGGESTTIGVVARRIGLLDELRDLLESGLPAMGTCAGATLLAKSVRDRVVGETRQPLLAVMNIEVVRNYYGRQRESFEVDLKIPVLGEKPFRGVFIRAPAITRLWGRAKGIAELDGVTVAAEEDGKLALAFHPELTGDTRIHRYFIENIKR
ncbi:pyridoxal phosphate synthase yaaE subunit [Pyrodictium delaneyi]|uniref:Pyridoxal 5'-phosphate synthase subunit PdxT n=1 Tax=Pyrodictium delaneyi TaxID=1273541 RepID=A0A0P0N2X4_9CREN|nr:pyridoxal 5'-phosphate synthase glutaminase subunit PdxT [Pyrodictium delaneyi]ALL00456.1 pyridoxal phosphate synthase yaaE subunit [Pyrodictium delaneyi]OWJ53930.1 pyridoxal 5'-phosphate synthase glutaminase subunit PdxT [Pyrodictium delaneyi]